MNGGCAGALCSGAPEGGTTLSEGLRSCPDNRCGSRRCSQRAGTACLQPGSPERESQPAPPGTPAPPDSPADDTGLDRCRAQDRLAAVHAGVEGDDKEASIALLARQERPMERALHHRPEELTVAAGLLRCRAHELRDPQRRSQSDTVAVSSSNDGTATGPVPDSRLCISCERDGAATAANGIAQP
jgi:hypothetical protein